MSTTPSSQPSGEAEKIRMEILGVEVWASLPYSAGHVLTEVEASVLNLTRRENIRNILARRRRTNPSLTDKDLVEQFLVLDANYNFSRPRLKSDPVQVEAESLAMSIIDNVLAKRGIDKSSIDEETLSFTVADLISSRPEIMEEARLRVENARALGASLSLPGESRA